MFCPPELTYCVKAMTLEVGISEIKLPSCLERSSSLLRARKLSVLCDHTFQGEPDLLFIFYDVNRLSVFGMHKYTMVAASLGIAHHLLCANSVLLLHSVTSVACGTARC